MNKENIIRLSVSLIALGFLAFIIFANKKEIQNYESFNDNYYYEDRTTLCAEALEELYVNEDYIYYLPCLQSHTIFLISKKDKKEYTLKHAIDNGLINIEEVKSSSIEVFEQPLFKTVIEILGTNIRLRKGNSVDYEQIENYYVTKGEQYEMLDIYYGIDYIWYQVEYNDVTGWFANNGDWVRTYKVDIDEEITNYKICDIELAKKDTKQVENFWWIFEPEEEFTTEIKELGINTVNNIEFTNEQIDLYCNSKEYFYQDSLIIDAYVDNLLKQTKISFVDFIEFENLLEERVYIDYTESWQNPEYGEYYKKTNWVYDLDLGDYVYLLDEVYIAALLYPLPISKYFYWIYNEMDGEYLELLIDYEMIKTIFYNNSTSELNDYLTVLNKVYDYTNDYASIFNDASLNITFTELQDIVVSYDELYQKYPENEKIKKEFDSYFDIYTGEGNSDNYHLFTGDEYFKELDQIALASYEDIFENHPDFSKQDELLKIYNGNK